MVITANKLVFREFREATIYNRRKRLTIRHFVAERDYGLSCEIEKKRARVMSSLKSIKRYWGTALVVAQTIQIFKDRKTPSRNMGNFWLKQD